MSIKFLAIVIFSIFFISGCVQTNDETNPDNYEQNQELLETGPEDYCDSKDDCWCRVFTGAEFVPGRANGSCDLETNSCMQCIHF